MVDFPIYAAASGIRRQPHSNVRHAQRRRIDPDQAAAAQMQAHDFGLSQARTIAFA
jgi:hypothetical protein